MGNQYSSFDYNPNVEVDQEQLPRRKSADIDDQITRNESFVPDVPPEEFRDRPNTHKLSDCEDGHHICRAHCRDETPVSQDSSSTLPTSFKITTGNIPKRKSSASSGSERVVLNNWTNPLKKFLQEQEQQQTLQQQT
eukprot:TRINITY_DN539_c0_g1_i3.p1 TRINITY_DN539_c0_g1~~TRINITY_DN539_c0_g1_i3.p1  ORF type:complete len:137 (+),score=24.98 TRINITY_DN539_c0_g1_i3:119-529(+)